MEKKKTYVLDTTVLIYDPDIFYKLGDADIVVPLAAIKELDGLKKSESDLVAQSAKQVTRMLDRISSYSDIKETGGKVSSGARIFIETSYEKVEGLASEGDQKIIGTALYLKKKGVENLILATTDTNMRIVGRTYGIRVEHMPYTTEGNHEEGCSYKTSTNGQDKKGMGSNKIEQKNNTIRGRNNLGRQLMTRIKLYVCYIVCVLSTGLIVDFTTRDGAMSIYLGVIIGSLVYMIIYGLYLRQINKHILYRGKGVLCNGGEESSKMLCDSSPFNVYYGSHPYFGSDKQH